jgi:formylglycine-generating enzyme required for sulfatase activity
MWGTFDMVGNVWEWVAEWGELATNCTTWGASLGDDTSCVSGDGSNHLAGAFMRGGLWLTGAGAGVGAIDGTASPSFSSNGIGFRCAR